MDMLVARNLNVSATLAERTVNVIENLDFSLAPGRILGLVGESGAGKSMIGRTVAQLLPPLFSVSQGELLFDGQNLVTMPAEARRELLGRDIAFVPQEPMSGLNPVLTIGQQIDEHLWRLKVGNRRTRHERAVAMLDAVHLPRPAELLSKYPHQLSGGMCQRVLIAMAFASRPKLLVADEPTTALDVTIQARIVQLIAEMQRLDGTSVLFITHDLRLAAQICDEILVLYAGRVAEYGPAREVFARPRHPYTRCLQLSNPVMSGANRGLYTLPERMPGLQAMSEMTGCAFASRCPVVREDCTTAPPPMVSLAPAHRAACWHSDATPGITAPQQPAEAAPSAAGPLLSIANLGKTFRVGRGFFQHEDVVAVKDVTFSLNDNEFVGIVGESGSGKSTVARMLCGLETPTFGTIAVSGRDVTQGDAAAQQHLRSYVQMVFQDPQSALNPRRRVGGIVTQALEASGTGNRAARMARAQTLISEIGLPPEAAYRFPPQLSGGQRQRVNIARALCAEPRILIADEIVSGLDVSVQAQLLNLLLRLRRERGFAMLLISHDLSVVRYLCDRVLVMYRGEVVESGPTADVFDNPRHSYTKTLLAAVPPDDPATIWRANADSAERDLPSDDQP